MICTLKTTWYLWIQLKKIQINENISYAWVVRISIIKIPQVPKSVTTYSVIYSNIPMVFLIEIGKYF